MNLIQALNWRYAVQEFSSEIIPIEKVNQLLEAARLSPSSYGLQPYQILVISSASMKQALVEHSYGQRKVADCSHLVVFAANTNIGDETVERYVRIFSDVRGIPISQLDNMTRHYKDAIKAMSKQQQLDWSHQQAYLSMGTFIAAAALMQIDCCPMTGIEFSQYDRLLKLAEKNLTVTAVCPIGFRHTNDTQASQPKVRFDFSDLVIWL